MGEVQGIGELLSETGPLGTFFVIVMGAFMLYLVKVLPEERKYRRKLDQVLVEQVALSRQALETSNEVIKANSEESRATRAIQEKMVDSSTQMWACVRELIAEVRQHDARAIEIAQDVAVVKEKIST